MRSITDRPGGVRFPGTGWRAIVLAIAALVLMAVVGLSYRAWERYNRANLGAAETRSTVDSVDQLVSSMLDAETGQRGYLLTGENRYLEPYNHAIQVIPSELTSLGNLLARHPEESSAVTRLNDLVNRKLSELRQTIELRRTQGEGPALAIVMSDRGKQAMDEIRAVCADIRRRENASQAQMSQAREAAAGTALLVTVAGSLIFLFLFTFRLEPFASPDPKAQRRSWQLRYGVAFLTVVVIVFFRMALTPLMGDRSMPFTLFFPAVWFAAWFGGPRPGALSMVLSALAGSYFFAEPTGSLLIRYHDDQIAMLMLVIVGFGMALLSRSQQQAVVRAMQAENAERTERQRFETTLASVGDAIIATDANGRVTFANKIAVSLTKWPETQICGKALDEVFRTVNESTRATVENPVARVLREGTSVGLANHTVLIARDGMEVPIDDSAAPIRDGIGKIAGVVLVFRDISGRRALEKHQAEQDDEMRRITHLLEPVACFVRDLQDRILYWNPGAVDLYGFSAEEAIGQVSYALLKTQLPAALDSILAQVRTAGRWDGELLHTRRDGRQVAVASHWALHQGSTGRAAAILEVNLDITRRKEAEEDLRAANEALSRANEDLNQFAYSASHDLQEPLRMVSLYCQLLQKSQAGRLDPATAGWLEKICDGANRMETLLRDILEYSQAAAVIEKVTEPVDVQVALEKALTNLQSAIVETGAVIEHGSLPRVRMLEIHLVQLLQNLIGNALKYRGTETPQVYVSAAPDASGLFSVRDNGIGFEAEYSSRIFGLFKRLHTQEQYPGTGVGLAICQKIIERYGGRIWAESAPGRGATFFFTLPI
jgi:PAS domain S-box-containing protein